MTGKVETGPIEWLEDEAALDRCGAARIRALTARATDSTFYFDGMSDAQRAANRQVVEMSGAAAESAAASPDQRLIIAFIGNDPAGFVIATRHAPDSLELDWLMVDPAHHGAGIAARLMEAGLDWLGADRPIWLTVVKHNERAIRFYRRFGFAIAGETEPRRVVPTWIMRRPAAAPASGDETGGAPLG